MESPPGNAGERHREALLTQRVAPVVFGVLVYVVIELHSAAPARTLPGLAWGLLGFTSALFLILRRAGQRLSISRPVALMLFALAASMIASNVLLSDLFWSSPRLGIYIADVLLALCVYLMYRRGLAAPIRSYLIAICLVHVPFLLESVLWVARSGPSFFESSARIANFAHVRHFGYLGFLAAISGSALLVLGRERAVPLLLAFAAVFGIALTGSRGALIAWMLFIVLLAIWFPADRRRILVHGLLAFLGACLLIWMLDSSGLMASPNVFGRVRAVVEGDQVFDSGRLEIWLGALREIAARPLFGLGTEAYQLTGCCNRTVVQPHNFILQSLMQFGVVGNALFMAFVWRVLRAIGGASGLLSRLQASAESRLLATMLTAYLAFGFIDGLFYHAVPMLHLALLCGLFAAALQRAGTAVDSGVRQFDRELALQRLPK